MGDYRGDTLATQGFVHASTGRQWTRPLRALFAGASDLVLLQVDERRVAAEVRYEAGAAEDPDGDRFPHIHGAIPVDAVVAVEPIPVELTQGWRPMPFPLAVLTAAARGNAPDGVDEWRERGWTVTTRPEALDHGVAAAALAEQSYWAVGRSQAEFERIMAHSIPFSLLTPGGAFAGMARVVSDRANAAYIADVFVLPAHRGSGRGVFLMSCVVEHPDLAGVRNWLLGTRDAHGLYRRYGFEVIDSGRWMLRVPVAPAWTPGPEG
jgi:uncharacterized protein (DUF952 family)/ribosomal protein S18 acetylase RimI-like enzyme